MNETPATSVADTRSDFKQGERVRIKKGILKGKIGEVQTSGRAPDGTPLYLITVLRVYEGDEIERVESEVGNG